MQCKHTLNWILLPISQQICLHSAHDYLAHCLFPRVSWVRVWGGAGHKDPAERHRGSPVGQSSSHSWVSEDFLLFFSGRGPDPEGAPSAGDRCVNWQLRAKLLQRPGPLPPPCSFAFFSLFAAPGAGMALGRVAVLGLWESDVRDLALCSWSAEKAL